MYCLLNLSLYVKSYRIFCQILAFFMMPAHQIWSCHVTQEANFENFLFCSNSTFNFGKITKFLVEKLSTSEVISQKPHGGGKHPSSAFRVKLTETRFLRSCSLHFSANPVNPTFCSLKSCKHFPSWQKKNIRQKISIVCQFPLCLRKRDNK